MTWGVLCIQYNELYQGKNEDPYQYVLIETHGRIKNFEASLTSVRPCLSTDVLDDSKVLRSVTIGEWVDENIKNTLKVKCLILFSTPPSLRSRPKFSSDQTFQTEIISDQTFQTKITSDQTFHTDWVSDPTFHTDCVSDQTLQTE